MMRFVMPASGVDDRTIDQEPIVGDVTTEMDQFVPHVAANYARHHEPADVWGDQQAADHRTR